MISKKLNIILILFVQIFICTNKVCAQQSEYEIKAALILTFAKYVEWPEKVFNNENRIILGILGDDPFGENIDRMAKNRSVKGRYWEIRRGKTVKDLKGAHIIFIGKSEEWQVEEVLKEILSKPITSSALTIGDDLNLFCENGGIINFGAGEENSKYTFDINSEIALENKIFFKRVTIKKC